MAELKDFEELSSCRADYKKVAVATEKDYPLHFCATLWVENADVARKASSTWSKVVAIVEYWKCLPKYKQPGKGDPKPNKSYPATLKNHTIAVVPLYFQFFEAEATKSSRHLPAQSEQ